MRRLVLLLTSSLLVLGACDKLPGKGDKKDAVAAPATLRIAPEDMISVATTALASGPVVTGSIQPERKADLRAEVSAVVLQVLKENGDSVKKGDVLVRLDQTAIRDSLQSATDALRNAELAKDQAQRNWDRLKTLRTSGMTSLQALDDAEVRLNAAHSEVSAANTRVVLARQQLERTNVRAPFDGVVSERKASVGDTAALGKELLKVIDPRSMRFAGRVSADKIGAVAVGQAARFRVNGYGSEAFVGKVTRVDPAANDVTRQVEVLIAFADKQPPQVAGLYAEGTIEVATTQAVVLPETAIVRSGDKLSVWRIKGNTLEQASITLGARDTRTGNFEVLSGMAAGDVVLRNPGANVKNGQGVERVGAV